MLRCDTITSETRRTGLDLIKLCSCTACAPGLQSSDRHPYACMGVIIIIEAGVRWMDIAKPTLLL